MDANTVWPSSILDNYQWTSAFSALLLFKKFIQQLEINVNISEDIYINCKMSDRQSRKNKQRTSNISTAHLTINCIRLFARNILNPYSFGQYLAGIFLIVL